MPSSVEIPSLQELNVEEASRKPVTKEKLSENTC